MVTRSRRLPIAWIALALMLFAQAAMAWPACDWLTRAPERAVRAAAGDSGCESMNAGRSGFSAACLEHCLSEKQSLYKAALDIPAMPLSPVLTIVLARDALVDTGVANTRTPALGTGPPRRILLQSFQI